jgi:hypothetical protein
MGYARLSLELFLPSFSFFFSILETFSGLSHLASFFSVCMFIAIVLCIAFAGAQEHPAGYDSTTLK